MRIPVLLALGSVLLSCGGGGASAIPAADACNQAAKAACLKVSTCEAPAVAMMFVGTEAACEAMILNSCGATGFQCGATQTYHGDKAQMCKDQFTALSCSTLTSAILPVLLGGGSLSGAFSAITQTVPPCGEICTAGADAGPG